MQSIQLPRFTSHGSNYLSPVRLLPKNIVDLRCLCFSIRTSSPFLPVIEDPHSSGLDPDLRYVEAATHIGVDGSKDHGILHQTFMPSGCSANGVTVAQRSANFPFTNSPLNKAVKLYLRWLAASVTSHTARTTTLSPSAITSRTSTLR